MKARFVIVAAVLVFAASSLEAQANTGPAGTSSTDPNRIAQDACQMGLDVFQFMAPQLGIALTGGNATLGRCGALGGLGHFSVGLRVNVVAGDVPKFDEFPTPS